MALACEATPALLIPVPLDVTLMPAAETQSAAARGRPRRPTILDVAEAAGVSKSAVSLAIRNQRGVSETTREHILGVAENLGYRSNVWARSLAQGRMGLVGVLLDDLGGSYYRDVTDGIEAAAAQHELRTVISRGGDAPQVQAQLETLLALGVEGVVIISSSVPQRCVEQVARRIPLVVVGTLAGGAAGADTVTDLDDVGVRQAITHLNQLGHTRIAHLSCSPGPAAVYRRAAFSKVMRELVPDVAPQVEGPENVVAALRYLIFQTQQEKSGPTAVLVQNDRYAAELIGAGIDAGLQIPQQLSVIGYGNSSVGRLLRPQLTSVDQARTRLGQTAMQLLNERIQGRTEQKRISIASELVIRDSTAPPPG